MSCFLSFIEFATLSRHALIFPDETASRFYRFPILWPLQQVFRRAFVKKKKKKTGILFKVFAERNLIGVTGLLCFCNSRTHGWTWTDKKKHGTIVSLTIFCLFVVSQEYQSNLLIRANLFYYSADINQEIEAFLKRCLFSCWDSFVKFMK